MFQRKSKKPIYWVAGFISLFLSYLASLRAGVINADAVCYLQSAQSMPMGFDFAMHLCDQARWPLYSMLIHSLTDITTLSYINSAYLIDGFFSLISTLAFIAIIGFLKNTPRMLWLAALTILLSHEFNAVREYIVRDHGFWACYLISILCFLKFFRTEKWRYAMGWSASLVFATLFRIEALVFLLVLPLGIFFRIKTFLKLNTLTLVGMVVLSIVLFFHPEAARKLSRINELTLQFQQGIDVITQRFHESANAMVQHVLSPFAARDVNCILFLMLLSWYIISVINNLTLIYAALVIYAWARKLLPADQSSRWILWGYILVNVVITAGFLVQNMFLSKRYLLALSLTLMLWVPFALDALWTEWRRRKWPLIVVLFFMMTASLGGIFNFGYSKKYMSDAGYWLANHVAKKDKIYSNSLVVMYYSQHFGYNIFTINDEQAKIDIAANQQWKQYDYVVLTSNKKQQGSERNEILTAVLGKPIQVFQNKRGDAVNIYHISKNKVGE